MAELKHRSCPLHVKSMGTKSESPDDPVPFSLVASVFYNVDACCEIVDDGAFDETLPYYLEKGFVTVEHEWDEPIGKPMAARATSEGPKRLRTSSRSTRRCTKALRSLKGCGEKSIRKPRSDITSMSGNT